MKVSDMKQEIKDASAYIKTLKLRLSRPHVWWSHVDQSVLDAMRRYVRSYFWVYAFMRGRNPREVEVELLKNERTIGRAVDAYKFACDPDENQVANFKSWLAGEYVVPKRHRPQVQIAAE